MAKQLWSFEQKDFIKKHDLRGQEEGVCLALAARWSKMRLKRGATTAAYFEKQAKEGKETKPALLASMQQQYDAVREPAKEMVDLLAQSRDVAFDEWFNGRISEDDYKRIEQTLAGRASKDQEEVKRALSDLFWTQNLTVADHRKCNSFQDYYANSRDKACYVFICRDLRHAFAGYYVHRPLWLDEFYFFDPNSGEYLLQGSSDLQAFMAMLRKGWEVPGHADRYEVTYARGN